MYYTLYISRPTRRPSQHSNGIGTFLGEIADQRDTQFVSLDTLSLAEIGAMIIINYVRKSKFIKQFCPGQKKTFL